MWDIQVLFFPKGDITIFWLAKKVSIITSNVAFKLVNTDHNTLIIFKSVDMLLALFPIGN
jgi:hypothetical protein